MIVLARCRRVAESNMFCTARPQDASSRAYRDRTSPSGSKAPPEAPYPKLKLPPVDRAPRYGLHSFRGRERECAFKESELGKKVKCRLCVGPTIQCSNSLPASLGLGYHDVLYLAHSSWT